MDFEKIKESMEDSSDKPFGADQADQTVPTSNDDAMAPVIEGSKNLGVGGDSAGLVSVTKLITDAINIYKSNFKTLAKLAFLPIVVYIVGLIVIVAFAAIGGGVGLLLGENASALGVPAIVLFVLYIIGYMLAIMYVGVLSAVAILYALKDNNLSPREALRLAKPKFWTYLVLSFLWSLIVTSGFMLFIIPGIVFLTLFAVVPAVMVAEDLGGFKALSKSSRYVKPHFFGVLGRILVVWIVSTVALFSVFIITGGIDAALSAVAETEITVVTSITNFIVNTLLTPMIMAVVWVLYGSLRSLAGDVANQPVEVGKKEKFGYVILMFLGVALYLFVFVAVVATIGMLNNQKNDFISEDISMLDWQGEQLMPAEQQVQDIADTYGMSYSDTKRSLDFNTLLQVLYEYKNTEGKFPESLEVLVPDYMSLLPNDPATQESYSYTSLMEGADFELCATYDQVGEECVKASEIDTMYGAEPSGAMVEVE